eukprot:GHVH01011575.1.p1 GENE.GHVH01011575.1~~GHVH01011575.1.p1  ORF type:complete len:223 (+),score=20.33 GHVH01011575.1:681-1349(+)
MKTIYKEILKTTDESATYSDEDCVVWSNATTGPIFDRFNDNLKRILFKEPIIRGHSFLKKDLIYFREALGRIFLPFEGIKKGGSERDNLKFEFVKFVKFCINKLKFELSIYRYYLDSVEEVDQRKSTTAQFFFERCRTFFEFDIESDGNSALTALQVCNQIQFAENTLIRRFECDVLRSMVKRLNEKLVDLKAGDLRELLTDDGLVLLKRAYPNKVVCCSGI